METPEHGPEGDLTGLERRLAHWQPASGMLDRDRMLYEAGRAAARAESWGRLGFASAACLALVAIGLGGLFVRERAERHSLEAVLAAKAAEPVLPRQDPLPVSAPAPDSYLALTPRLLAADLGESPSLESVAPRKRVPSLPEPPRSLLQVRDLDSFSDL